MQGRRKVQASGMALCDVCACTKGRDESCARRFYAALAPYRPSWVPTLGQEVKLVASPGKSGTAVVRRPSNVPAFWCLMS